MYRRSFSSLVLAFLLCLSVFPASSIAEIVSTPVIVIIIDDIGYRINDDLRAVGLPGKVALAIMPHSPYARKMSVLANELGKDVLLHMPMQATEENKNKFLGPGALTLQMTEMELKTAFELSLKSVPHASGVNNHMGSLLTRHPGHMNWLMQSLKDHNKFYVDSVTSNRSIAGNVAKEMHVPYLVRDIFLDNEKNEVDIEKQFNELIRIAKHKGRAVAIGHPYPVTMNVLSKKLVSLDKAGVQLISPREMLRNKVKRRLSRQAAFQD